MRTRTVVIPSLMLAIAVSLCAGPLAAQPVQASRSHETTHEVYAPSVTLAIYLVNFLLLYMANPDLAAYMPAYKAAIPQAVAHCLEQNPEGCPYATFERLFDRQISGDRRLGTGKCFWPVECHEERKWTRLAPRKARRPKQINKPLGMKRAAELARALGMDESMILTEDSTAV